MKTKLLSVDYLGFTAMDRRFSSAMLPWVLIEIRRRGTKEKLCLGVECGSLTAYDVNFELQFSHKLQHIMRFTQVQSNPTEFLYLLKDNKDSLLYCYLFQASTTDEVTELFGHMKELAPHSGSLQSLKNSNGSGSDNSINTTSTRKSINSGSQLQRSTSVSTNKSFQINPPSAEQSLTSSYTDISSQMMPSSRSYTTGLNKSVSNIPSESTASVTQVPLVRSSSNAANLTSLCVDISPSNSHFFEVLYVGKIKVSHKKVPETLIDDALGKFKRFEFEKVKTQQMRRNSLLSSQADSFGSDRDSMERSNSTPPQVLKKVEFAPLPLPFKCDSLKEDNNSGSVGLMSPSLTPLESQKHFFNENTATATDDVENEFDKLSAIRAQSIDTNYQTTKPLVLSKKSFPVALEPQVLILNQNQCDHNLETLTEDESESSSVAKLSNSEPHLEKECETPQINSKIDAEETRDTFDCTVSKSKDFLENKIEDDQLINGLSNKNFPENKQFNRDRSASIGTLNLKTPITQLIGDQNRTMLFQVGRADLRLISPDRKQILLHKQLRDVASCVQGVSNKEHFGFICRETDMESFVGYVFKCQSSSVASDVVGAITQAFVAHADLIKQGKEKPIFLSCEHCPMVWYHKLCQDVEGLNEKRIFNVVLRRVENLPEEEQIQVMTKYQGGSEDLNEIAEKNAFLMMLLRAHCEAKQQRHVHDTAENRSEFLNQYLGGSTIFMKAKRSLSSSFDHLLKRKASKDDIGAAIKDHFKKESSPISGAMTPTRDSNLDLCSDTNDGKSTNPNVKSKMNNELAKDISLNLNTNISADQSASPQLKSPMMDIFMKLGNSPSGKNHHSSNGHNDKSDKVMDTAESSALHGSWRQAIFYRVSKTGNLDEGSGPVERENSLVTAEVLLRRPPSFSNLNQVNPIKRTKVELRELWKNSITQAILLIRMEKENARLRARQEVSAVKRIKLEYEDIGGCGNENSKVWDMLTAPRESRLSTKVDSQLLFQAIRHGVPRAKRGEVWYFLAEQYCLHHAPPDIKSIPNYNVPYESLLKQLTSYQHAILIDLGRTFPNHTYFSSPLGPGQLALFNLLKAYSLLDPEVGYCQGLSFVAGVLLLHLDEAEAFLMLRHLMFRRGLRKQYLPDMIALQIQLYQLSRLLKDHIPELYDKFDMYDVSPTLYAAPWILTIFTSQFPLGFVTRVFDLLFLESSEVIFRVAIALLEIHKDSLMQCDSFEEIMDYMKHKMPNIDKPILDKVIKLTFTLDFGKQLNEYQVEYHVLQEEMIAIAPKMEELNNLEKQNKQLLEQNRQLQEQIETSASKISSYRVTQCRLENQVKSLEQTVANLARFVGTTHDKKKDSELPNDIRKICQQVQQSDRKTLGVLGQKLGQSFTSKFSTTDFTTINNNGSGISEESGSDPDDKNVSSKSHHQLKTGMSTPNLFGNKSIEKSTKVEAIAEPQSLDKKSRQFLSLKKSYSYNAGLGATSNQNDQQQIKPSKETSINSYFKFPSNARGYPLRVLDETNEYEDKKEEHNELSSPMTEPKKPSKFFAHSHEQIRQEKMLAEQLKRDFDENLRKLDAKLSPYSSFHQAKSPASPCVEQDLKHLCIDSDVDSGVCTPASPPNDDKNSSQESFATIKTIDGEMANHPLVSCDLDIKFDVHSTKLKTLRPSRVGRTSNIDGGDSRN